MAIAEIDLDAEQTLPAPGGHTIAVTPRFEYLVPDNSSPSASWVERGTRMHITGRAASLVTATRESAQTDRAKLHPRTGGDRHHVDYIAGAYRPVAVYGVVDGQRAYRVLADTIRAQMVYDRLIQERRDRAATVLREARATYDGLDKAAQFQYGRTQLMLAAERVALWGHVPEVDIMQHAGLTEEDMRRIRKGIADRDFDAELHYERRPSLGTPLYLDIAAVAERLGVEPATVRAYKARGILPDPGRDPFTTNNRPAWEWDVIEARISERRGQDWAAGTTADETGRRGAGEAS
ncbi:hypothetical protein AB0C34_17495 [Nocardia sp. NPDC049220]|uniref:hypothetical protein n=1 Tax=Nocardia sp. NPDC049220 TaxID=3155273 RepID=UPI0033C5DFBA